MRFFNTLLFSFSRRTLFLLCGCFLVACQGKSEQNTTEPQKTLSFSKEIGFPPPRTIVLLPEAKTAASEWLAFVTVRSEMEQFENYTIGEAANNAPNIRQMMTELQKTVPEVFRTPSVIARLKVLTTLSEVLEQKAARPEANATEIEATAQELPPAFENLKIQLNEVFRKGIAEFEQALDQKADSLQQQR